MLISLVIFSLQGHESFLTSVRHTVFRNLLGPVAFQSSKSKYEVLDMSDSLKTNDKNFELNVAHSSATQHT